MAELKTKPTGASVKAFLDAIPDARKRKDAKTVMAMMQALTGDKPRMWGPSIVGFGAYHYKGASGREGDWFLTGFAPRKQNLTLYLISGLAPYGELLERLGKHKVGGSCLYLKSLDDVDLATLRELIKRSVESMKKRKG